MQFVLPTDTDELVQMIGRLIDRWAAYRADELVLMMIGRFIDR